MNKVYDKTEFLKYMNKWAKELYSSSELNYWDCYYALHRLRDILHYWIWSMKCLRDTILV